MPIIVPIEENEVGIDGLTDENSRAEDDGGSGLEVLGKGLATLGDGGMQFANALDDKKKRELAAAEAIAAAKLDDNHQRNMNDAAAKNAYVGYSDKSASLLHGDDGLFNQNGVDAHAAFPATVAALADAHDQALAPLDPIPRGVVAPILAERLNGDVDLAARHVQQQGAVEQRLQSLKQQQANARDAVLNADDPDLHDHHMATGENAIRQQAKIDSLSDKDTERQVADYISGVHADTIEALTPRDPADAAVWYAKFGGNLNQADRNRVAVMLAPAPVDDQPDAHTNRVGAHDTARPLADTAGFADRTAIDPSFGTGDLAQNNDLIDANSADASASGGQAYSANATLAEDDGNPALVADGTSSANGAATSTEPIIAKGDGGAPMPIHMDMHPSAALWRWLQTPAGADQYVIDTPPDFVTRFRQAVPEFVRRENAVFAASKSTEPPLEHALLVYQSLSDPHKYVTRTVAAKDQNGIFFHDFDTGQQLPFGRLPQLSGFKLIIAEHTHPRPWYDPFRHITARRGPTNMDVAMSKFYPDVHFIINASHTNDFLDGENNESYYFGQDVVK